MTDRSPQIRVTAMLADSNPSGGVIGDDGCLRARVSEHTLFHPPQG